MSRRPCVSTGSPACSEPILDDRIAVVSLNWFYARVHVPAIFFTLVLIYLYRNESWRRFRNVLPGHERASA